MISLSLDELEVIILSLLGADVFDEYPGISTNLLFDLLQKLYSYKNSLESSNSEVDH